MRCPFCGSTETQVKDSRQVEDQSAIRRRRQCSDCGGRFTTFERVQLRDMIVLKKNGKQEMFEREKLFRSMKTALQKRPIDEDRLEKIVNSIVRRLESLGESEITADMIGEMVMDALSTLDQVAYIRYASVYKDFHNLTDFNDFLEKIADLKKPDWSLGLLPMDDPPQGKKMK